MNVLGKIAKGVGGVVLGTPESGSEDAEVERLLQRVSDGVLAEDRREALALLRDLLSDSQKGQLALGATGFPVLCGVLREERSDTEMVRGALECLLVATNPQLGLPSKQGPPPAAINAELFLRGKDAVPLLLSLLEDAPVGCPDFYVRFHTVQLLTALSLTGSYRIQEAILASPMGVVRLMDLLAEREVVRNEALLLLIGLSRASADIQKIAAFEGAFDRLLTIIREEGGAGGGIIVQDCLELLNNLLRGNAPNQLMFREMGHLAAVASLLASPAGGQVARQRAGNLLCALETVYLLASPPTAAQLAADARARTPNASEQNTAANRAALLQGGVLEALMGLAVGGSGAPAAVRGQALRAVAQLVAGTQPAQQRFLAAKVLGGRQQQSQPNSLISAPHAVLRTALYAPSAAERAAAQQVLRSFCAGNAEGQSMLVCTIMPVGDDMEQGGPSTFGGELVAALVGMAGQRDLQASWRAAGVLAHLVAGNSQAKQRVLTIPLAIPESASMPPQLLMPTCVKHLTAALSSTGPYAHDEQLGAVMLLRMLLAWLHDCPPAVGAFLSTASHLPFLVDVITGRMGGGDASVMGLAALLLGICLIYNPQQGASSHASTACSAAVVLDVIAARIGLSEFFACLDGLQRSDAFVAAAAGPKQQKPITREAAAAAIAVDEGEDSDSDDDGQRRSRQQPAQAEESPFDYDFTQIVNMLAAQLRQRVMTLYSRPGDGSASRGSRALTGNTADERLQSAQLVIVSLEREVEELRARLSSGGNVSTTPAASLGIGESSPEVSELQMRASRAEVQASTLQEQVDRLRGDVARAEAAATAARNEVAEARSAAAKHESDLEDLSGAYNALEAHSFQLEAQVRELRAAAGSSGASVAAGPTDAEIESRITEAVEAARADADDSMADLLECLGQEEAKVEVLRQRLESLGEDVDGLLEGVGCQEAEYEGS